MRESTKKRWESGRFTGTTGMKLKRQKDNGKIKVWWNNGQTRVRQVESPGDGWKLGMKL